jgi:hypothetical protein
MAEKAKVRVYSDNDAPTDTTPVRQGEVAESLTNAEVVDTNATYSAAPSKRRAPNWILIVLLVIAALILFNIIF